MNSTRWVGLSSQTAHGRAVLWAIQFPFAPSMCRALVLSALSFSFCWIWCYCLRYLKPTSLQEPNGTSYSCIWYKKRIQCHSLEIFGATETVFISALVHSTCIIFGETSGKVETNTYKRTGKSRSKLNIFKQATFFIFFFFPVFLFSGERTKKSVLKKAMMHCGRNLE